MPESCRQQQGQRRQIRNWLLLYGLTCLVIGMSWGSLRLAERQLEAKVFAERAKVQLVAHQRIRAAQLRSRLAMLLAEQQRFNRLAWPVRIGDIIAVLWEVAPDSVTFTSVSLTPRQVSRTLRPQTSDEPQTQAKLTIELRGVAVNDAELANFLSGLESHGLFGMVAVDYSRRSKVRDIEAREFGLTCEIELKARYRFAAPDEVLADGDDEEAAQ
jgi:hypothetical protein